MNTLEIPAKKIFVSYPSQWEEMDRKQAVYAGKLLYKLANKQLDVDQFRKLMVDKFIRRVNNIAPSLTKDDELDLWGNDWLLAETVNFFFKVTREEGDPAIPHPGTRLKGEGKKGKEIYSRGDRNVTDDDLTLPSHARRGKEELKVFEAWEVLPTFTKNLIPWFRTGRLGRKIFYGPGDFLQGMVFSEYKDALAAAMKYMDTNDDYWLDRLAAILYRPKRKGLKRLKLTTDFDGQTRVPYNQKLAEHNTGIMKGVNRGIKYMIMMYVMGCLWTLKNETNGIEIDGNKCDFSILFKRKGGNSEGDEEGIGMIGIMMAIAESGVFGNLKDVANTDVWDVLVRMYQMESERMEFEKRMERSRTHK